VLHDVKLMATIASTIRIGWTTRIGVQGILVLKLSLLLYLLAVGNILLTNSF
jgi:hypothetical protein